MIQKIIVFCILFVLSYSVQYYVHFYYDDYAYAGLTYFYATPGLYDERFTMYNFINFLYKHYMGWGGRVFSFGIAIPVMHFGPYVFYIFQSVITAVILLLSARVATVVTEERYFYLNCVIVCTSYMGIGITVMRESVYWAVAACLYLWPMLFFLPACLWMYRYASVKEAPGRVCSVLCCFVAAVSAEVYGLLAASVLGAFCLLFLLQKNHSGLRNILPCLGAAVLGLATVGLAPGNFRRAGDRLLESLPQEVMDGLLALVKRLTVKGDYDWGLLFLVCCAVWFYFHRLLVLREKQWLRVFPLLAGIAGVGAIFILPAARYSRVVLPLLLLFPIVAAPFICWLVSRFERKKVFFALLAMVCFFPLWNYWTILQGYRQNHPIMLQNDRSLSEWHSGDSYIVLKKLHDDRYGLCMPYEVKNAEGCIKSYYDIPHEVQFVYIEAERP
ncbi:DUF6056 family protein [uncultured Desulfovibrio sp.]|uniref:DUF6056 family protein n=1 Tax=uncultured Desulfovibrio sp. TaxID=167968 RepID=UPI00351D8910